MSLKVKLVKSVAGSSERQVATVVGLGLGKFGSERILQDTPAVRGMVKKVAHLITFEVVKDVAPKRARSKPAKVKAKAQTAAVKAK
jgi:large subunit ribosomal protein L30